MNIEAIRKARVCYWSDQDQAYIVNSPIYGGEVGHGSTRKQAHKIFEKHLQIMYIAYLEDRHTLFPRRDRGRPSKGIVSLDTDVQPETKEALVNISKVIGCSLGETIDYLLLIYMTKGESQPLVIPQGMDSAPWYMLDGQVKDLPGKKTKVKFSTDSNKRSRKRLLEVREPVGKYSSGKIKQRTPSVRSKTR